MLLWCSLTQSRIVAGEQREASVFRKRKKMDVSGEYAALGSRTAS
jgi:hypothetical protein